MRRRLAAGLFAFALVWLPTVTQPPQAQAATCTGWQSTLVPPPTIRVLRSYGAAAGTVQTVDFQSYVENVMYWEFIQSWPAETLKAGAVAVKEYGWYYTMHYRGGSATGGCWDVQDNTYDQMYRPEGITPWPSEVNAVHATWGVTVTRNGNQFLTGYWSGSQVPCGSDADGIRMYQWGARDCGLQGYTMSEILTIYYNPGLRVNVPTNSPSADFLSAPAGTQTTIGTSGTVTWVEDTVGGATVASRQLTLVRAKAASGTCPQTDWLPVPATWSNGGASPQTLSGLQAGYCYRVYAQITDSSGRSSIGRSGSMLVDASAPVATFTSPAGRVAASKGTGTVSWIEKPAAGTTIASRTAVEEYGWSQRAGTCANVAWLSAGTIGIPQPISLSGMGPLMCYRFRVTLTDSAGHAGTWYSGQFVTPATFS